MSVNVRSNEPIFLNLLLAEQDDTKYVSAVVKNQNGVEFQGSPFQLNNIGDGEYSYVDTQNLVVPEGVLQVVVIYQIFDDENYIIPTVDYAFQVKEVFRVLDANVTVSGLEELQESVNKVFTDMRQANIEIDIIEQPEIEIEVSETL